LIIDFLKDSLRIAFKKIKLSRLSIKSYIEWKLVAFNVSKFQLSHFVYFILTIDIVNRTIDNNFTLPKKNKSVYSCRLRISSRICCLRATFSRCSRSSARSPALSSSCSISRSVFLNLRARLCLSSASICSPLIAPVIFISPKRFTIASFGQFSASLLWAVFSPTKTAPGGPFLAAFCFSTWVWDVQLLLINQAKWHVFFLLEHFFFNKNRSANII